MLIATLVITAMLLALNLQAYKRKTFFVVIAWSDDRVHEWCWYPDNDLGSKHANEMRRVMLKTYERVTIAHCGSGPTRNQIFNNPFFKEGQDAARIKASRWTALCGMNRAFWLAGYDSVNASS